MKYVYGEDIGNINYGYMGRLLFFLVVVLCLAVGFV